MLVCEHCHRPMSTALEAEFKALAVNDTMTIWVSNSCGQLFIFNGLPKGIDVEGEWWPANDIDHVVGNNYNSCDWGELAGEITRIETPAGGWEECEDSDDGEQ